MEQQGARGPKTRPAAVPAFLLPGGGSAVLFPIPALKLFLIFLFRKHKFQVTHSLL